MRVEGLTPIAVPTTMVAVCSHVQISIQTTHPLRAVRLVLPPTRLQLVGFRIGSLNLTASTGGWGIDLGVGLDWFLPEPLLKVEPGMGAFITVHNPTVASLLFDGAALWCRDG